MSEEQTPLDFLRLVYSDPAVPLPVRMRAAIEAAPYCHAKLQVTASLDGRGFAEHMKQLARERYPGGFVIDAKPIPKTPAATPQDGQ